MRRMNGYTQDVIDCIDSMDEQQRKTLREMAAEVGDDYSQCIYLAISRTFITALDKQEVPALAKEFVARVMMHEIDWKAVAAHAAAPV